MAKSMIIERSWHDCEYCGGHIYEIKREDGSTQRWDRRDSKWLKHRCTGYKKVQLREEERQFEANSRIWIRNTAPRKEKPNKRYSRDPHRRGR